MSLESKHLKRMVEGSELCSDPSCGVCSTARWQTEATEPAIYRLCGAKWGQRLLDALDLAVLVALGGLVVEWMHWRW